MDPLATIHWLRAIGAITDKTTEFVVKFGDVEQTVGVRTLWFLNGGSWSLFVAPCCGKQARVLKVLDGVVLCWRCCVCRGVRYRVWPMSLRGRAENQIPRLRAMLETDAMCRCVSNQCCGASWSGDRDWKLRWRGVSLLWLSGAGRGKLKL